MKFNTVVCGGTFDHLHKGHESFLRYVFSAGNKIIVGVTSDEYIKRGKGKGERVKQIESFEERKKAVIEFIQRERFVNKIEIVKIDDLFGPTLSKNLQIDAIVVSNETRKGVELINKKRKELGLKELSLIVAVPVYAEDGQLISSARIRNGQISRSGKLYVNPLWLKKNLVLPKSLRGELKKPFGVLISKGEKIKALNNGLIATVGDITTKKFNEFKLNQQVSVIDFKVERQKRFSDIRELGFLGSEKIIKIINPAGSITSDLFKACLTIWNKEKIILSVDGEEDLAVLPLILTAPLKAVIYYGQPNEGVVKIEVSEEIKEGAYRLVSKFEMLK